MYDDGIKSSGGDVLRKLVLAFVAALSCGVLYGQGDVTRAEIADVSHLIEYNNEALEAGTEGNVLLFVTVEENGPGRGNRRAERPSARPDPERGRGD